MKSAYMTIDTASILKQCFDELNQGQAPPTGLLIALDILRRNLAELGRIAITTDMMNVHNVELLQILLDLGIVRHASRSDSDEPPH